MLEMLLVLLVVWPGFMLTIGLGHLVCVSQTCMPLNKRHG